ncbi:MAG: chemotaxis protein CheB [Methylococcales bacterium]|nr:chemotaxis protein CheB [Methylococcales bacterium]
MEKTPYKVLVIHPSALVRQAIITLFEASSSLEVIGDAKDGQQALKKIPTLQPDVITLDIGIPYKESLTTIKRIMIFYPTPIILLNHPSEPSPAIFDALSYGAVDFLTLSLGLINKTLDKVTLKKQQEQLIKKVFLAAKMNNNAFQYIPLKANKKNNITAQKNEECNNLVILGVGEGGYGALLKIIPKLSICYSTAYIVVVYDSPDYLSHFIHYLNYFSTVNVQTTLNNIPLEAGGCYISTGDEYVTIHGKKGDLLTYVSSAPFSSRRGSIDMLMFSAAEALENPLGVILSGEGSDGAEGLEEIVRTGGGAIIQAPANCLYTSMPQSALNLCEEKVVVADREIATEINNFLIYSVN